MKATAKFIDTGNVEASVTLVASMRDWNTLRDEMKDLPYYGLAQQLRSVIDDMTDKLSGRIDYEPAAPTEGEG